MMVRSRLALLPGFSFDASTLRFARLTFAVMALLVPITVHALERTVIDAFGREVRIDTPDRVVTLGPDVTEIAFAIGAGDVVVGLDRSSKFPEATATKPNLGYRRQLSAEGILALRPDLILASEDIGPPEVVDILRTLSIAVVFIPEDNSLAGIRDKIALISSALGREAAGKQLSQAVSEDFDSATKLAERIPATARKKVLFFHGLLRLTAAGTDTAADAIIGYSGGTNPFVGVRGYKALSEEALLDMAPDTILMMGDGKGGPTPEEVFAVPALRETPAARNKSLVVLDGPYMLGFGPRTATAIRDLTFALYPEHVPAQ